MVVPDASALAHVTSVHLRLQCEDDGPRAASVVLCMPQITELAIHGYNGSRYHTASDLELAERHKGVISLVFGTSTVTRRFPLLKSLLLKGLHFKLCTPLLATAVDADHLETLKVVECIHADHFLKHLGPLQLACGTIRIEDSWADRERIGVDTNSFLQTISAPRELYVSHDNVWEEPMELDWDALIPHSASLRSLRVNIVQKRSGLFQPHHQSMQSLQMFCKSVPNLQRLALTSPSIEENKWEGKQGFLSLLVSSFA